LIEILNILDKAVQTEGPKIQDTVLEIVEIIVVCNEFDHEQDQIHLYAAQIIYHALSTKIEGLISKKHVQTYCTMSISQQIVVKGVSVLEKILEIKSSLQLQTILLGILVAILINPLYSNTLAPCILVPFKSILLKLEAIPPTDELSRLVQGALITMCDIAERELKDDEKCDYLFAKNVILVIVLIITICPSKCYNHSLQGKLLALITKCSESPEVFLILIIVKNSFSSSY
jgi:hypothetical protein